MLVTCPQCGQENQEPGKYCENCGMLIPDPNAPSTDPSADAASADPAAQAASTAAPPDASSGSAVSAGSSTSMPTPAKGARFSVVQGGQANPQEGFTITRPGEFLVGRMDTESQHTVDIDLRQWVKPIEVGGQKQYLVHRKQCYLGLDASGAVTIKAAPGAENDTLIQTAGQTNFIPVSQLGTVRPPNPDSSFPMQPGDRLFIGDPDALQFYQANDPTAEGTYLVLELVGA